MPKLDNIVLQIQSHKSWLEWNDHYTWTSGYTLANIVRDVVGLLGYMSTLVHDHDSSWSTCCPPGLSYKAAYQPGGGLSVLSHWVTPSQIQYYAFTFVELCTISVKHFNSLSWPTWTIVLHPTVPSNLLSSTNLLGVHSIPSLKFLKKLYSIDPNVSTKDVTNNWFLFRLCAIDHILNSLVSFQPLCCSLRQPVSH